jgi:2-keto-3-deoxy-L-rhamnonate aldolase RhmA/quercetin dioxygenase-like cupin family protein
MNSRAIKKLREKLARDECVYGLWITLEAPSITEMAVSLGFDWVTIDAEHGHLDWGDIVAHLRAAVRSDTVALVRVAENNLGLIKRALDIGADGVIVPWVESAEQLRQAVSFAHYPPTGLRGIGAERATCWGSCFPQHVEEANENVLVIPIIETVKAAANVDKLLEVPGVDVFFFGPADYSSTAGYPGQWEGPGVADAILKTTEKIRARGKGCGVVATSNENLAQRKEQGFRMLSVGLDGGLLVRGLRGALASIGRDQPITPGFTPDRLPAKTPPLARPPESLRPDRPEVMTPVGKGVKVELAPGVVFESLVGSQVQARNLTTGIVTFAPGAKLPQHAHTFGESITLLSGRGTVEVEGRLYNLATLDNVIVPRGLAHSAMNRAGHQPAVFHIALASDNPARELVNRYFSRRTMPDDSRGSPGAEYVTRFRLAEKYTPGPGTAFVDYMNRDLVPGIEMSGGFGVFEPGGRLPAHVHDFDESICIVEGVATCIVEGRNYSLSNLETALQPRGRVHYFINESKAPMAMIWVYAGPMPERLIVDERCATEAGNPWK